MQEISKKKSGIHTPIAGERIPVEQILLIPARQR
jgi:hypothetical protein